MSSNYSKIIPATVLAVAAAALSVTASAAPVTGSAGFQVAEDFESFDGLVTGSAVQLAGNSITATSSIPTTYGAYNVDLGFNGSWGAGNNFLGTGNLVDSTGPYDGSVTFRWTEGLLGVGADFSIYQVDELGTAGILLEALSFAGDVLESQSLTINFAAPFSYDLSTFAGFLRGQADVYGLRVSGDGFVLDNIAVAPVPVPAALPLLLSGLAGLGALARRRRREVV